MQISKSSLYHFRGEIPGILLYEVISKGIFFLFLVFYNKLTGYLLWTIGKPAFSSGDLPFKMRSWQGWLMTAVGFLALLFYELVDITASILICDRLLHAAALKPKELFRETREKIKIFRSGAGIRAMVFVTLFVPLFAAAFGITITENYAVPELLLKGIKLFPAVRFLYYAVLTVMLVTGFLYLFTFHFAVLGNLDVREAMRASFRTMKKSGLRILGRSLWFLVKSIVIFALVIILVYFVPEFILTKIRFPKAVYHAGIIFITLITAIVLLLYILIVGFAMVMKLTTFYQTFTQSEEPQHRKRDPRFRKQAKRVISLSILFVFCVSCVLAKGFERYFPPLPYVDLIAHRAGGTLSNENTVRGLEAALRRGVVFSEIDVQRTKDGYYIINHDKTFKRCCKVDKSPGEMTLEEIKQLRVVNANRPMGRKTEVATIEEMLDAAKERSHLFIELKGESADLKMAADIREMLIERDMLDSAMMISMDYELIDQIETNYPEIKTGYLCYFSYGDVADLNCDALLLEAETATKDNVDRIHELGKEVDIWTVNSFSALFSFLTSDVDGIITDEVGMAKIIRRMLIERSDATRVLQALL